MRDEEAPDEKALRRYQTVWPRSAPRPVRRVDAWRDLNESATRWPFTPPGPPEPADAWPADSAHRPEEVGWPSSTPWSDPPGVGAFSARPAEPGPGAAGSVIGAADLGTWLPADPTPDEVVGHDLAEPSARRASGPSAAVRVDEAAWPGPDQAELWPRQAMPGEDEPRMRLAARQALRGFAPSRLNIRALVVVAVLVVVGAGWLVWYEQPRAEPVAPAPSSYNAPSAGAAGSPAGMIVVAVEGKVQRPGLVRLPSGSRVADAITAAGGVLPGVDVSNLNLARKLTDGELILVAEAPPPGSTVAASDPAGGGKVDLNTATVSQLDALPGIGPELAQRIIDYRTQHGGFRSVDQLQQVTGIGDAKYAEIKDLVTV